MNKLDIAIGIVGAVFVGSFVVMLLGCEVNGSVVVSIALLGIAVFLTYLLEKK